MGIHLELEPEVMFYLGNIPITDTVVFSWFVIGIIIIGAIVLRVAAFRTYRKYGEIPVGIANFAEFITEGFTNFTKNNLRHHWKPYVPYIGAIGLFLALANTLGMYGFGLKPPTRDFNLPLALATMTLVLVILSTISYKGFFGFIKSFFQPIWWFFPLKIIEYFARLTSLTARLFGNILAAFIVMEIVIQVSVSLFRKFYVIGPGIPAVLSFYFDIFDGLLQAFVFVFLSILYIEEAYEE